MFSVSDSLVRKIVDKPRAPADAYRKLYECPVAEKRTRKGGDRAARFDERPKQIAVRVVPITRPDAYSGYMPPLESDVSYEHAKKAISEKLIEALNGCASRFRRQTGHEVMVILNKNKFVPLITERLFQKLDLQSTENRNEIVAALATELATWVREHQADASEERLWVLRDGSISIKCPHSKGAISNARRESALR